MVAARAAPTYPSFPGVGKIYKGPDSETIIQGPDGSVITAKAEGGAVAAGAQPEPIVVTKPEPVIVEEPEPLDVVDSEPLLVAKPEPIFVAEPSPIFAEGPGALLESAEEAVIVEEGVSAYGEPETVVAPVETKVIAEPVAVATKETQKAELVGPSGSISTDGVSSVVSGPASTTITGPAVTVPIAKPLPVFAVPKLAPLPAPVLKFAVPEGPRLVSVELPKAEPVSISIAKAPFIVPAEKFVEPFPGFEGGYAFPPPGLRLGKPLLYPGYPVKAY